MQCAARHSKGHSSHLEAPETDGMSQVRITQEPSVLVAQGVKNDRIRIFASGRLLPAGDLGNAGRN